MKCWRCDKNIKISLVCRFTLTWQDKIKLSMSKDTCTKCVKELQDALFKWCEVKD